MLAALPHLEAGFAAIEAACAALDVQRAQEIHIAALPDFAELWLKPRLGSFRASYPHYRFCINGEGDAPFRLARVDCEIGFCLTGPEDARSDRLFGDLILPISSPKNFERTMAFDPAVRLEGFPLLHLDFYRNDSAGTGWPDWFAAQGIARTAPERGMHFQRIGDLLNAILADAGIALCGVALLSEIIDAGRIDLPFPVMTAIPIGSAFQATYKVQPAANRAIGLFRSWLCEEARKTADWLDAFAKTKPRQA